jgi:hypothetical protein
VSRTPPLYSSLVLELILVIWDGGAAVGALVDGRKRRSIPISVHHLGPADGATGASPARLERRRRMVVGITCPDEAGRLWRPTPLRGWLGRGYATLRRNAEVASTTSLAAAAPSS